MSPYQKKPLWQESPATASTWVALRNQYEIMRDQKIIIFFEKLFVVLVLKRTSNEINSFIQWLRPLFNGQWPLIRYKTEVLPSESNALMYILLFAAFPAVLIVDFSRASANVELFVLHTQPNTEYLLRQLLLYY